MIKYFRKIRQNLLSEGKSGKPAFAAARYFKYAIGEIILVVVGILIALQINNWNEKNKLALTEDRYLERIYSDLEQDSLEFFRRLKESKQEINSNYEFVHEVYKKQKSKEEYTKLISLTNYGSEHLVTQSSTFLEMVSAGQLGIISNDSLKAAINELYRDYEIKGKHIQEFNEYTVGLLQEQFKILLGVGAKYRNNELFDEPYMYDRSDWEYINDPKSKEFKISLATAGVYSSKHRIFINYFEELIKKTSKVRAMITVELNMDNE